MDPALLRRSWPVPGAGNPPLRGRVLPGPQRRGGGRELKPFLAQYPGLFILKAFTKNYAMAGLRLGCGLTADGDLLTAMGRLSQPWNVSLPAQAAGLAALEEREFLERARQLIVRERSYLRRGLERLGLEVCPSRPTTCSFTPLPPCSSPCWTGVF